MKKILKASFVAIASLIAVLSNAQTKPLTIVQGSIDKENARKIFLYRVVNGEMQEYASTQLDDNNNYAFALANVKEGFFYLGDNLKARPVYYRFYLKPGETVSIAIHQDGYDIQGKSEENKILDQWEKLYAEIAVPAFQFWSVQSTYVTFFPAFNAFLPKAEAFKKKINTRNKQFNSLLLYVVDNDIESAAINFIYTPRSAHPSKEEYPAYYNTIIQKYKYCDTRVLNLGDAMNRVNRYAMYCNMNAAEKVKGNTDYLKAALDAICNDTLKGMYVVNNLGRYKTLENLQAAIDPLRKYFVTDSISAKYQRYESTLATYAKGEKAYNFAYPDINGDTVTLASLKGKVVLVDVWATWCMPCRVEIPHLKKLEEELHDKAIAFVSLSVDEAKDEEKWKNFVKKESLTGLQLYARGFSDFAKYYKINAIPRFLVFDKEGKIVTIDSPRPSQPELKELLLKLAEG